MTAPAASVLLLGAEESPALPVIWSLSRKGVPVTVASHRRICTGALSRFPAKRMVYPNPVDDEPSFLDWLERQVETRRHPVTLGCGEQITYLLSRIKSRLSAHTSIPLVDPDIFMLCRDKSLTMKAAAQCGVPTPETWYPEETGIEDVARRASYPAVLKPCVSNGARGISFHDGPEELRRAYPSTHEQYGPCIVQERIPHEGMQYKAELLLDEHHEVRLAGVYAKLRYYPPTGGSSTLNETVRRDDICDHAGRLLRYIRWQGMGDCDFIVDPRDGIAKLMEVNPRFTRTIRVLVDAGIDFPYELYRFACGKAPRIVTEYEEGILLRYLPADLVWFLKSKDRFRTRPSFFRFFSRKLYYEEWSARDPLTGVGFWLALLIDLLDPAERRRRLR